MVVGILAHRGILGAGDYVVSLGGVIETCTERWNRKCRRQPGQGMEWGHCLRRVLEKNGFKLRKHDRNVVIRGELVEYDIELW